MNRSATLHTLGPRIRMMGLRVGALVLLFYGASFFTRDWRPIVPQAGQPAVAQAAARSKAPLYPVKAVLHPAPAKPDALPSLVEPVTTGALPRSAEAVTRPSASPPPRQHSQPVAPRSRVQQKRTQLAAGPTVRTPSPVSLSPSSETPIQFRLADRGN